MTVRQGLQVCPELILIQPDFDLYRSYSRGFMSVAKQYTPLIEALSLMNVIWTFRVLRFSESRLKLLMRYRAVFRMNGICPAR